MGWRATVRRWLAGRGLAVERLPPALAACPDGRLRADLDLVLDAHLSAMTAAGRAPEDFFLVQVGAFDGRSGDPLHKFIGRVRPTGLLVEPEPRAFAALCETYRDHPQLELVQAAVAKTGGERTFYSVRADGPGGESLPSWAAQLSSLDRDTILRHRREIPDIAERIEEQRVTCVTFGRLLEGREGRPLDLLAIDAEGYDWQLLRSLDLGRHRPAIVRYEHQHLSPADRDAAVGHLLEHGYRVSVERADTLAYSPPARQPGG